MKLTLHDLKNQSAWERAGIALPSYDPAALAERTKAAPAWVHMGIGNIFRIFMGSIADQLVSEDGWIGELPVWSPLILMWWIKSTAPAITWRCA